MCKIFCHAQNSNRITISGIVIDQDSSIIASVNIIDLATRTGTTSGKKGVFNINLSRQPVALQFSCVGFETSIRKITNVEIKKSEADTLFILVKMKQKIIELDPFVVNENKIELVYKKSEIMIIDYEFHMENIILLLLEDKTYKLRMINGNQTALYEINLRRHPEGLKRDCLGNLHVMYSDSVYQMNINLNNFEINSVAGIKKFMEVLSPCVASTDNDLYLAGYSNDRQTVQYFALDRITRERKFILEVCDKETTLFSEFFIRNNLCGYGSSDGIMGENSIETQRTLRKIERAYWYYQIILSKSTFNPLYLIQNHLIIFDHISDTLRTFDLKGELVNSSPINYHYQNGWKEEMYPDYGQDKMYAKYTRDGLCYLSEINLENGQVIKEYRLDKHIFPEKIKIRNGYAYYLFKKKDDFSVVNLYRQKLE